MSMSIPVLMYMYELMSTSCTYPFCPCPRPCLVYGHVHVYVQVLVFPCPCGVLVHVWYPFQWTCVHLCVHDNGYVCVQVRVHVSVQVHVLTISIFMLEPPNKKNPEIYRKFILDAQKCIGDSYILPPASSNFCCHCRNTQALPPSTWPGHRYRHERAAIDTADCRPPQPRPPQLSSVLRCHRSLQRRLHALT